MTKEEFSTWLDFHQEMFPEVSSWLQEHKSETLLSGWANALKLVDYEDANDCTNRMVSGVVEHPNRFEISRLPAAIVKNTPFRVAPIQQAVSR